jgi:hypothetical protein
VFSNNQQAREVVLEGCASLVVVVVASCSRLGSLVLSPPSSRGSDGGVARLVIEGCAALTRVALPPGTSPLPPTGSIEVRPATTRCLGCAR